MHQKRIAECDRDADAPGYFQRCAGLRQTLFLHAMHELPECDASIKRRVGLRRRYVAVGITGENRPRRNASGSSVIALRRTRSEPGFADDRLLQRDAMATGSINLPRSAGRAAQAPARA